MTIGSVNEGSGVIRIPDRKESSPATRRTLGGRYEIEFLVRGAGSAEVLAARDRLLERRVTVKLHAGITESSTMEMLRKETVALARVDSPHVLPIYDIGIDGHDLYLVTQHVQGLTLEEEVSRFGPVAAARACRLVNDVLLGISALHCHGLHARDLEASSIVVDGDDRAIVMDLGHYVVRDDEPAPHSRTDVHHVGRLLVFLLAGPASKADLAGCLNRLPVSLGEVARRALDEQFNSIEQFRSAITAALIDYEHAPVVSVQFARGSGAVRTPTEHELRDLDPNYGHCPSETHNRPD
ncbi:MAG: protein kinase [Kofleriaceae bacterium]